MSYRGQLLKWMIQMCIFAGFTVYMVAAAPVLFGSGLGFAFVLICIIWVIVQIVTWILCKILIPDYETGGRRR